MIIDAKTAKRRTIMAEVASPETARLEFNTWFGLSPDEARNWLNRKLEDARQSDPCVK